MLLEVSGLSFERAGVTVLQDVALTAAAGELVYLIGGNGSGKTTFLKVLLGLLPKTQGEIKFAQKPLGLEQIVKYIGYLPQYQQLDRTMPITVAEILQLECEGTEFANARSILSRLNAEKLLPKKLGKLSGGELQKVMLARSLAKQPKLLLLDEPTNNLDQATIAELFKLLAEERRQGLTVLVVLHDHNLISEYAGKIYRFNEGKVEEIHKISELHHHD
jgi:zinc transport system ATP-binding protein